MELLLTKPLTDLQIILAKYFAGLILVVIALAPTLVYYFVIRGLGNPPGNIDSGGTWGSYIGLLLLAAGYVSIGMFASSLTNNQIVSFLLSAILCLFLFTGFQAIGSFELFGDFDRFILNLGMQEHYIALSLGLIDSRDVVYFLALVSIFILLTRLVLQSRKW
jgi:ABC-2 type transport system permease protein